MSASVDNGDIKADTSEKAGCSKAADLAVAGPSSRPSPSKKDVEVLGKAMQLLAAGKRDLLISDPTAAVVSLANACELLGDHYGEVAYECAEAYYYYGVALLDLARMEAGVIDNVMDGIPEASDDAAGEDLAGVEDPEKLSEAERDEVAKQVDEALDENYKELEKLKDERQKEKKDKEKNNDGVKANGHVSPRKAESEADEDEDDEDEGKSQEDEEKSQEDEEKSQEGDDKVLEDGEDEEEKSREDGSEDKDQAVKDNESIGSDDKEVTAAKDEGDASAVEKEDEEDPSNLQLAWEMLDLAKTILLKKAAALKEALESSASESSSKESKASTKEELESVEFRIGDAFQTLGELSIENENYPQAIEDLNSCLAKRQSLLPADSRCIAETHYQLGVAKGFNLNFEDAVDSLNEAINVLQKRIDNLKNKTESQDPNKAKDAFYTREKEIAEIEKLIPEIREKIADTEDMKRESSKKIGDRLLDESGAGPSSAATSTAAAVSSSGQSSESKTNGQGPSKEASTVSSTLIKKRKKSGDLAATDDASSSSKKPHLETNGHNGGTA